MNRSLQLIRSITTISEDLTDRLMEYFDEEVIAYYYANQKESKKNGTESKYDYYTRLAKNEQDPLMSMFYEYSALLAPEIAMHLARDFYVKQVRSGTYSLEGTNTHLSQDDEPMGVLDVKFDYGNAGIDKGIFAGQASTMRNTPERNAEVSDLLEVLFFKTGMSREGRICLIARLMTGSSTGRTRINRAASMDISTVMRKIPKEYAVVVNQMSKLVEAGIPEEDITATLIMNGKMPSDELPIKVPRLMGKYDISDANKELRECIKDLVNDYGDDVNPLVEFMYVNESKGGNPMEVVLKLIGGKKVAKKDAFRAMKSIANLNKKLNTPVIRSKYFANKDNSQIAKVALNMLSSNKQSEVMKGQALIMAPVMFNKSNPKLKHLLNHLTAKGKRLL